MRIGKNIYTFVSRNAYNQNDYLINVLKKGEYEEKDFLLAMYDLPGGYGMVYPAVDGQQNAKWLGLEQQT